MSKASEETTKGLVSEKFKNTVDGVKATTRAGRVLDLSLCRASLSLLRNRAWCRFFLSGMFPTIGTSDPLSPRIRNFLCIARSE